MSGRNPTLCCTFTALFAMNVHQNKGTRDDEPRRCSSGSFLSSGPRTGLATRVSNFFFFFSFFFISLIADGPHHYHPAFGHKGSSHLSRFTPYNFLSRCKFSTLTTRQPMVEFYLLTLPRFPLRRKEHKSYFGKNRTHDFRTSRCAGCLLDHSGDEAG